MDCLSVIKVGLEKLEDQVIVIRISLKYFYLEKINSQFKSTFLFIGSGTVSYKRVHDSAISDNSDSDSEEDLLSEENQFLIIEKL